MMLSHLELREIFHLEFLRWIGRKVKPQLYALKGGINLRFFFNSLRYSEDMDLDIYGIKVGILKDVILQILRSAAFLDNLRSFNIAKIIPPNITKAKQTETTQKFKIHLITYAGEDLFTKIEFSRRGIIKEGIVLETISDSILRKYKLAPLIVPHYNIETVILQKIDAVIFRKIIQARDIFDLYILSSQYLPDKTKKIKIAKDKLKKVNENIFEIDFKQFKDTVLSYLSNEDQALYNSEECWDEVRLKVSNFIKQLGENNG